MKRSLPKVLILYTGGTFGMAGAPLAVPNLSAEVLKKRLRERVPELEELARCDLEVVLNCDSAHIGPDEWVLLAQKIRKREREYDGFVILHGTDTLAYSASALSFLLRPCRKPVVITGAQRPLAALRTDARRNLISAVEIAAHGPRETVSQVTVFFDDLLFQGNRVRKRSASDFAAFESPKAAPLAWVGTDIRYGNSEAPRKTGSSITIQPLFSRKVAMLHVTPAFPAAILAESSLQGLDALVLVIFQSGTAPTHDPGFQKLIREARDRVPIVLVTESANAEGSGGGGADPSLYAAGRELLRAGCLWAGDLTPECAYVKTSLVAGNLRRSPMARYSREFARLWAKDLANEGVAKVDRAALAALLQT